MAVRFAGAAGALVALAGCGSLGQGEQQVVDDQPIEQLATKEPVPALVPEPEGYPLPPRNPRIAERWPPEIKEVVDKLLALYPKASDERPLSIDDVEQKMGIKLTKVKNRKVS